MENLRKQAKQLLRWHRESHYPVASIIRAYSTELDGLTDTEVLNCPFKLADAQVVVARREGFESWQALTAGVEPMTKKESNQAARPSLIRAEPQLFVNDLTASCRYYETALGFTVAFAYSEPPFYAQVARDDIKLNLRLIGESVFNESVREREKLLSASITVKNIKGLFLEFQAAGAVFNKTLHTEPWGARTFIVKDPDDNLILFAE